MTLAIPDMQGAVSGTVANPADAVLQAGVYRALYEHAAGNDARGAAIATELLAFLDQHKDRLDWALHVKFARWVVKWLPDKFKDRTAWVL